MEDFPTPSSSFDQDFHERTRAIYEAMLRRRYDTTTNPSPSENSTTRIESFLTSQNDSRPFRSSTELDLRDLEYVTEPNEALVCTICAAPFIVPMELGCGHIFCEDCISEHLACGIPSASSCPKCRRAVGKMKPVSSLLSQMLDELEVRCPNRAEGCEKSMQRYTVRDHAAKYCQYGEVACPDRECAMRTQRRWVEMGCLHAEVQCVECGESMMQQDYMGHLDATCRSSPIECQHCGHATRRSQLPTHLETACLKVPTKCPGSAVGCPYSDTKERLPTHVSSCPMATMSTFLTQLQTKQTALQQENSTLRAQLDSLTTRLNTLQIDHDKLAQSISAHNSTSDHTPPPAAAAAPAPDDAGTRIDAVSTRLEELAADYNSRLDNATSEAARLHMEMINAQQQVGQRFYTLNGTVTALRSQLNHLLQTTRPAGSAAGGGAGSGSGLGSGTGTGGGGGSGVGGGGGLETVRREPPKL